MALRPLENYVADLQVANPRIMGPVVERQARLQRCKDFHDAEIEALIRLTSDQARAREIWERWGHNSLRLRGQRAIFKAQLIGAGLLTRQNAANVAIKYEEPKLAEVKKSRSSGLTGGSTQGQTLSGRNTWS